VTDRAVAPVLAATLLLVVTVALGSTLALLAIDAPADPPQSASFSVVADPADDRIVVEHRGGDVVDASELRLRVTVDAEPLAEQPPVPFFAADGFRGGPTGPFNPAGGTTWRSGETAGFRIASTNAPRIEAGDRIRVTVYANGAVVGSASTTA
jgi:FlaG/FlaF family flagellin (archaellin)